MAIFLTEKSRVIVQGMTGSEGQKHTARMLAAGTAIVGGVNPRKAGTRVEFALADGARSIPVFGTVTDAVAATGADVSVIFVPPAFAKDAVIEVVDAGVPLIVIITEGIPVADTALFFNYAQAKGVRLIGPNCPGLISPGKSNVGITPADITGPGKIGLVSKSGTLTYQMMYELRDLGFSTAIGIGGDPIIGTRFIDALKLFRDDDGTKIVVLIGEIGGSDEETAAAYIKETSYPKPVVAFISGRSAPPGKRMGHAGAIISGGTGTPQAKVKTFEEAGVPVGNTLEEVVQLAKERLG